VDVEQRRGVACNECIFVTLKDGTGERAGIGTSGTIAVGDQGLARGGELRQRHEQIEVAEFTQTGFAIGESGEGRAFEGDRGYAGLLE